MLCVNRPLETEEEVRDDSVDLRKVAAVGGGELHLSMIVFRFHGSVHHISVNENTNLMQQP